jgi:hypothetical protein
MKVPLGLVMGCALALSGCGGEFPEPVPQDELPVYNIVITKARYAKDGNYIVFSFKRGDGGGWDSLAENYEASRAFDIVDWITVPDDNYFSRQSRGAYVYLHAEYSAPAEIGFDTSKPVYLLREEEYFDGIPGFSLVPDLYEVVFAKAFITTARIEVTDK